MVGVAAHLVCWSNLLIVAVASVTAVVAWPGFIWPARWRNSGRHRRSGWAGQLAGAFVGAILTLVAGLIQFAMCLPPASAPLVVDGAQIVLAVVELAAPVAALYFVPAGPSLLRKCCRAMATAAFVTVFFMGLPVFQWFAFDPIGLVVESGDQARNTTYCAPGDVPGPCFDEWSWQLDGSRRQIDSDLTVKDPHGPFEDVVVEIIVRDDGMFSPCADAEVSWTLVVDGATGQSGTASMDGSDTIRFSVAAKKLKFTAHRIDSDDCAADVVIRY